MPHSIFQLQTYSIRDGVIPVCSIKQLLLWVPLSYLKSQGLMLEVMKNAKGNNSSLLVRQYPIKYVHFHNQ
jgi:hypothetical protein